MKDASTGPASRSPIKNPVKRQAGQSLEDYLDSFVSDESFLCAVPLGFALLWLLIELLNRHFQTSTPLWLLVVFVILAIVNCFVRFRKTKRRAKLLRQGRDGERYVAQVIEKDLIPDGYRVVHDLFFERDGRKFNIDHLLIGRNGVFCLETKTWSKPFRGETIATYDGSKIYLNGIPAKGDAIGQARALAKEAEEQIRKLIGVSVKVTPFVVCIGWFIDVKNSSGTSDVLVVNEKGLKTFVKNCPGLLEPSDVDRIWQRMMEAFA
ncbi:MAG: NERD domain-containing protein [Kiritimatiellae bacterium]|nr:NERD domain-containing protein [Kiritimatiellia bacterium]